VRRVGENVRQYTFIVKSMIVAPATENMGLVIGEGWLAREKLGKNHGTSREN
jgi:hypothetical protein